MSGHGRPTRASGRPSSRDDAARVPSWHFREGGHPRNRACVVRPDFLRYHVAGREGVRNSEPANGSVETSVSWVVGWLSHRCRVSRTRRADKKEPLKKSRSPAAVRSLTLTWYIICTTTTRYGDEKGTRRPHTHSYDREEVARATRTHAGRGARDGAPGSPAGHQWGRTTEALPLRHPFCRRRHLGLGVRG